MDVFKEIEFSKIRDEFYNLAMSDFRHGMTVNVMNEVLKSYDQDRTMPQINSPEKLEKFRQEILAGRDQDRPCISICAGAGCIASGADEVIEAFK